MFVYLYFCICVECVYIYIYIYWIILVYYIVWLNSTNPSYGVTVFFLPCGDLPQMTISILLTCLSFRMVFAWIIPGLYRSWCEVGTHVSTCLNMSQLMGKDGKTLKTIGDCAAEFALELNDNIQHVCWHSAVLQAKMAHDGPNHTHLNVCIMYIQWTIIYIYNYILSNIAVGNPP